MLRLALGPLLCALALSFVSSASAESAAGGEYVIPAGQDELLGAIVGRGASFPGDCAFAGGQVEHAAILGKYGCPHGEIALALEHPSRAPAGAARTERFAITVRSGSPPAGFLEAFESWVRAHEGSFQWQWLPPPAPTPSLSPPASAAGPAGLRQHLSTFAVGLLALIAVVTLSAFLRRRVPWRDKWLRAAIVVLAVSTGLRCWLAVINDQQNDNHLEVAAMIAKSGWQAPDSSACMECSHPKLYHYALALAFDRIPARDMVVGNLLGFAAATALLILLLVYSRDARWSPPVGFLGVAFLSCNAGLVGISSQATNDLFCILFSSLAIFCLDRFLARRQMKLVAASAAFLILAAHSKATGWAIFASAVFVLLLTTLGSAPRLRKKYAAATAALVLGFLCVTPLFNPYRDNILRRGTPFVNDAFDLPQMKEEVARVPDGWVVRNLFTFRFVELLRHPFNEYGTPPPYPLHRDSLWSQLYGRTFFLRFDQGIWQNQDPRLLSLGRACLVLGLLPLLAFLAGVARLARSAWRGVSGHGLRWLAEHRHWHHIVHIGAMTAALIAIVIAYHRLVIQSSWMKAFYLMPAILAFFTLFLDGLEALWRRHPRLVTVWMSALVAASMADIGWLIHDLSLRTPR
jgi:hypothetical protein